MAEVFETKEVDGRWYLLTMIEEPGDPIYERDALGIRNIVVYEETRETWEPLATYIVEHRALALSDERLIAPITLAEALIAEGWSPPGSNQDDAPASEPEAICPSCGGDAADNWFDRTLCTEGDMHTRCKNCGFALDGCGDESPASRSSDE
jgi:hypothetical protein